MTHVAMPVELPDAARLVLPEVRNRLPRISQRVTDEIRATVPQMTPGEGRQQLIYTAVNTAAAYFLDHALGTQTSSAAIDDLYRKIGFREADAGNDLTAIDSAMTVAVRACWDEIRVVAADHGLTPGALDDLREALDSFNAHLAAQVRQGHDDASRAREEDTGLARQRLLDGLLSGTELADLEPSAVVAGWPVPAHLVVSAIELPPGAELDTDGLPTAVLCRTTRDRVTMVTEGAHADGAVEAVRAQVPDARLAVCWPVERRDAPSAYRWAQRALSLVRKGVIPARPVVDCAAYRTEIWLHAEPVMRRQLAQELLQPLFEETQNSREILSETLLVWLETRESAPQIAVRLGVHPQTVRYRWRRINELFGDSLHDPEFVVQMTLLLRASVPLWLAGDQSDFERYREGG